MTFITGVQYEVGDIVAIDNIHNDRNGESFVVVKATERHGATARDDVTKIDVDGHHQGYMNHSLKLVKRKADVEAEKAAALPFNLTPEQQEVFEAATALREAQLRFQRALKEVK